MAKTRKLIGNVTWAQARRAVNLAVPPLAVGYTLHIMAPQPGHFDRYVAERARFEPAMRALLAAEGAQVTFSEGFFYGVGEVACPGQPTLRVAGICSTLWKEI
jgi:hypothetical protein